MATRKTAARSKSKPKHAYRLLVKLEGSEPTVWRLISMPGHMTLADLDRVIQAAMGWTNSHMHLFAIDGHLYGLPDDEWIDDKPVMPDEAFTLDDVLGTAVKGFLHEYDFGDGWHHDVTVQGVELADEQRNSWPMCLAGANACPPEDVGGLGGYEEFLQAISDPSHEQHDAMWRWCGGPFDPKGFDINSANRAIRDWLSERR
jgi:Plasmid pRiA4b ORF-3-like protein